MAATATKLKLVEDTALGAKIAHALKKPDVERITLRLEKPLYNRVKSLIDRTGARNVQDAIRQALIMYEALISEAENGKDILVTDPTGADAQYPLFKRE